MTSHRHLKERHATTRPDLKSLKREHQSIVKELHSLKSKLKTLDNKLERADDTDMEFEVVMFDV
jgi:chromosome segregation ATPase